MTKKRKQKEKPRGYYRDNEGRTRPITSKSVGAALAKGVVIKRVVDSDGQVVKQPRKVYELRTPRSNAVWVAHITGPDPQYRFARRFFDVFDVDVNSDQRIYYLEEGIYEYCLPGNQRVFLKVHEGGEATKISKARVEKLFPK